MEEDLKNGDIIEKGGKKRMFLNGCFVIHEPYKENEIKEILSNENNFVSLFRAILTINDFVGHLE